MRNGLDVTVLDTEIEKTKIEASSDDPKSILSKLLIMDSVERPKYDPVYNILRILDQLFDKIDQDITLDILGHESFLITEFVLTLKNAIKFGFQKDEYHTMEILPKVNY